MKIVGIKKNNKRCFIADTEDLIAYLSMQELLLVIICPSHAFNPSMGNRLYTVKQILEADIYEIVGLEVKISTKSQSK